jgi:hypothetical protein
VGFDRYRSGGAQLTDARKNIARGLSERGVRTWRMLRPSRYIRRSAMMKIAALAGFSTGKNPPRSNIPQYRGENLTRDRRAQ